MVPESMMAGEGQKLRLHRRHHVYKLVEDTKHWSSPSCRKGLLCCSGVLETLYLCPNGAHWATWLQDPTRFTGTTAAFVKTVRHEGTRTLWSGLPATLVMTVPAAAVCFTAYDQLKAFLCGPALTSDLYAPIVASALAHLGTVTVTSPWSWCGQSCWLGSCHAGSWAPVSELLWLRVAGI
ncbi:hypothetical protein CB1_000698016 [Camelus ferus]|nr:hypothetical protein CB1_000698016 [Camelus ferus]